MGGAWVAGLVEPWTLGFCSGVDLMGCGIELLGLHTQWGVSLGGDSLPLPLCLLHLCTHTPPNKWINLSKLWLNHTFSVCVFCHNKNKRLMKITRKNYDENKNFIWSYWTALTLKSPLITVRNSGKLLFWLSYVNNIMLICICSSSVGRILNHAIKSA